MATTWTIGAGLCLAIWLYLLEFRGGFWRCDERLMPTPEPADWPAVIAIVPARDEAASIREAITALLAQDYPGPFHVVLVDDESRDGTAEIARRAAAELGAGDRLDVVATSPRPAGWVGKVWAMARAASPMSRRPAWTRATCSSPMPTSTTRPTASAAWWPRRWPRIATSSPSWCCWPAGVRRSVC